MAAKSQKVKNPNFTAAPISATVGHISITSRSSNYAYDISFQSLGSQESSASNGMRFGGELKKLWSFEDKRAKLNGNFATETPFGRVFRSCETTFGTRVPFCSTVLLIFKLRNGLREFPSSTKSTSRCENAPSFRNGLRNCPFPAKSPPSIEMTFKLRN